MPRLRLIIFGSLLGTLSLHQSLVLLQVVNRPCGGLLVDAAALRDVNRGVEELLLVDPASIARDCEIRIPLANLAVLGVLLLLIRRLLGNFDVLDELLRLWAVYCRHHCQVFATQLAIRITGSHVLAVPPLVGVTNEPFHLLLLLVEARALLGLGRVDYSDLRSGIFDNVFILLGGLREHGLLCLDRRFVLVLGLVNDRILWLRLHIFFNMSYYITQ